MPSEKGFLKLLENFACFQDKLTDEVIFMHLISLVNKAKKPEIKVINLILVPPLLMSFQGTGRRVE